MRTLSTIALAGLVAFAAGCEDNSRKIRVGGDVEDCNVTNQTLADSQWVMWEAMPDGTSRANPRARMKFRQADSGLKVDYTVGSPYEVRTYDCKVGEREVNCAEEPKLMDWCLSLETHKEGSCSPQALKDIGAPGATDAELQKAIEDTRAELKVAAEQFKDDPRMMAQYKASKNTLANKLQGLLDVRVREKKCQLMVTDQYMTLYNGQKIVDSNPVGTNPFVQDKDNTWLYENCEEGTKFLALSQKTPPTDEEIKAIDPQRRFTNQDEVHYHYIGTKHLEAEEGCTYSADTWAQWKPKAAGVEMSTYECKFTVLDPADETGKATKNITKCVDWSSSHTWTDTSGLGYVGDDENLPRAMYGLTRYKTCADGKKEKLDTICASARVMEL